MSVRSPAAHAVVVEPPPRAGGGVPTGFGVRLVGPDDGAQLGELAADPALVVFRPGEAKRHVLDFVVGATADGRALLPGAYRVVGTVAGRAAACDPVPIGP